MPSWSNEWGFRGGVDQDTCFLSHENGERYDLAPMNIDWWGQSRFFESTNLKVNGWRQPSGYFRSQAWWKQVRGSWRHPPWSGNPDPWRYTGFLAVNESRQSLAQGRVTFGEYYQPIWPGNENAHALDVAYQKLNSSKAQFGAAMAETRKTVTEIAKGSEHLFRGLVLMKRNQWYAAAAHFGVLKHFRNFRTPADWWLSFQYGIRPLLSDIHDLVGVLEDKSALPQLMTGRGTHKTQESIEEFNYDWLYPSSNPFTGDTWMTNHNQMTYSRTITHSLTARVVDSDLRWAQRVGLANPASVIWETVPWSFVIDWACPIGNVLESLSTPMGLEFVGGYKSCYVTLTSKCTSTPDNPGGWFMPFVNTFKVRAYERIKYWDWPLLVPYEKSPYSDTHTANAIALLRSLHR